MSDNLRRYRAIRVALTHWTSLSSNAEMPIGRVFPWAFGMWTCRIG
jgi:hypothetical protein